MQRISARTSKKSKGILRNCYSELVRIVSEREFIVGVFLLALTAFFYRQTPQPTSHIKVMGLIILAPSLAVMLASYHLKGYLCGATRYTSIYLSLVTTANCNPFDPIHLQYFLCVHIGILSFMLLDSGLLRLNYRDLSQWIAFLIVPQLFWILANGFGKDAYGMLWNVERVSTNPDFINAPYPVLGILDHWMHSGGLLVMTVPHLFRKGWTWFIPLVIIAVILMDSDMTTFSLVGMGLVWVWFNSRYRKWILTAVAIAILTFAAFKRHSFYAGERYHVWKESISWTGASLFGNGPAHYAKEFHQYCARTPSCKTNELFDHPHNEYISLYHGFGFVGVGLVLLLLVGRLWASAKTAYYKSRLGPYWYALVGLLLNSFGSFPMHLPSVAMLAIISLASLTNETHNPN